jgi:phage shock protein PspC (stress-responsive transcriptional regulator)
MNPRRLYRCRHDRQLAGVAGGMAEYLELDPTLVRILWILSAFFGGFTILLYVILAFVIPLEPGTMPGPTSWQPAGPAWGAPQAAGSATGEGQPAPGTVEDGGAAAGPDAGAPASAWQTSWHEQRLERRRRGRGGLYVGVLLIVFGAFALANTVIPGWAGVTWFGPALLVGLGIALLAGSFHRGSYER